MAELGAEAHFGRATDRVYLFGISNGGHVVRRLVAESPRRYDGGIDWEGVYWAPAGPNILIDLPVPLRHWPGYRASGFSSQSAAHQAIVAGGYPPDIFATAPATGNTYSPIVRSLWKTHLNNYWEVTSCLITKELDPEYTGPPESYDYLARWRPFHLSPRIGRLATDGDITRPLITLHGLPAVVLQLYAARVHPAARAPGVRAARRLGRARGAPPPSQCIPRGGAIVADPAVAARPERCAPPS